ncbi:unnamed protein product [Effrenium voratum]|uniref:Uncharacterized protein n=1 Tax=Effrenium voratum TaxID=2562239 RepID=A0AA36IZZ3_9DINO|nr:unnamed protein product [Effrenium voratum]CAJ1445752.1 unnamed protein product [Effrenium voratum]
MGVSQNYVWAITIGALQKPYCHSVILTGGGCSCWTKFGGENYPTKLPRVCRDYEQGLHFEGILRRTLNENIRADADPPWYVCPGTFSAHLSRYDYRAKHGVDCHSDLSARYAECDPITSISWGIRSLLGVRPNPKLTPKKSAARSNENAPGAFFYQQRPGDITIMTGR